MSYLTSHGMVGNLMGFCFWRKIEAVAVSIVSLAGGGEEGGGGELYCRDISIFHYSFGNFQLSKIFLIGIPRRMRLGFWIVMGCTWGCMDKRGNVEWVAIRYTTAPCNPRVLTVMEGVYQAWFVVQLYFFFFFFLGVPVVECSMAVCHCLPRIPHFFFSCWMC